jgi:hypothetical protein
LRRGPDREADGLAQLLDADEVEPELSQLEQRQWVGGPAAEATLPLAG